VNKSRYTDHIDFLVHGIGLVSHESPRLTNKTRDPYTPEDAPSARVEHGAFGRDHAATSAPRFIKLEDTVAVTEIGHDVFGDRARGWNRAAAKPPGR
jgi:hypothetical protein